MILNFDSDTIKTLSDHQELGESADLAYICEFLDRLTDIDAEEKWVRVSHGNVVVFYAFDEREFVGNWQEQQAYPQVEIWAHRRLSVLKYLLPYENWPWRKAEAHACSIDELIELTTDAFGRCEKRREYIVINTSVG